MTDRKHAALTLGCALMLSCGLMAVQTQQVFAQEDVAETVALSSETSDGQSETTSSEVQETSKTAETTLQEEKTAEDETTTASTDTKQRPAPSLQVSGSSILNTTTAMEYRFSSKQVWTPVTGSCIENLEDGTYEVRYAADEDHEASEVTTLTIATKTQKETSQKDDERKETSLTLDVAAFGSLSANYQDASAVITVSSSYDTEITVLSLTSSDEHFMIASAMKSVKAGSSATATLKLQDGLAAGDYATTVTLVYQGGTLTQHVSVHVADGQVSNDDQDERMNRGAMPSGHQDKGLWSKMKGMFKKLKRTQSASTTTSATYTTIDTSTHNPTDVTVKDVSLTSGTKTISYGDGTITIIVEDNDLGVTINGVQRIIDGCLSQTQKLKVANGKDVTLRITISSADLSAAEAKQLSASLSQYATKTKQLSASRYLRVLMERKWSGDYTTISENNRNFFLTINVPVTQTGTYAGIQLIDDTSEYVTDLDDTAGTYTYSVGDSGVYTLTSVTYTIKKERKSCRYHLALWPLMIMTIMLSLWTHMQTKRLTRIVTIAVNASVGALVVAFGSCAQDLVLAGAACLLALCFEPLVKQVKLFLEYDNPLDW